MNWLAGCLLYLAATALTYADKEVWPRGEATAWKSGVTTPGRFAGSGEVGGTPGGSVTRRV